MRVYTLTHTNSRDLHTKLIWHRPFGCIMYRHNGALHLLHTRMQPPASSAQIAHHVSVCVLVAVVGWLCILLQKQRAFRPRRSPRMCNYSRCPTANSKPGAWPVQTGPGSLESPFIRAHTPDETVGWCVCVSLKCGARRILSGCRGAVDYFHTKQAAYVSDADFWAHTR